jgi:hypothetical protein
MQSKSEMKRLVELHFERCLIALTARKEFLLRDLDNKVNDNSMIDHHTSLFSHLILTLFTEILIQEAQTKLKQCIEGCMKVIKVGSQILDSNTDVAMNVWKVFYFVVILFFQIQFYINV